jgi:hypothetical protein
VARLSALQRKSSASRGAAAANPSLVGLLGTKGGYPLVAGPFWAIANLALPSNKTAARPIRADLVMIFSKPILLRRKNQPTGIGCSQIAIATNSGYVAEMSLRSRIKVTEPCLPSPATQAPGGPGWIREIKHDDFRIMAAIARASGSRRATTTISHLGFRWQQRLWLHCLQTRS